MLQLEIASTTAEQDGHTKSFRLGQAKEGHDYSQLEVIIPNEIKACNFKTLEVP